MKGCFKKRKGGGKKQEKSMRMSFAGTGGVKTSAVRAGHLWGRLMAVLRGNPNKIEGNKYRVTVWVRRGRVRKEQGSVTAQKKVFLSL